MGGTPTALCYYTGGQFQFGGCTRTAAGFGSATSGGGFGAPSGTAPSTAQAGPSLAGCQHELVHIRHDREGARYCSCGFVGVGTDTNVQFLCQARNTCYNFVSGWCGVGESQ